MSKSDTIIKEVLIEDKDSDNPTLVKIIREKGHRKAAEVQANMKHPNIVKILGLEEADKGGVKVRYEHLPGGILNPEEINSYEQGLDAVLGILNGLDYIHRKGHAHGNLKHSNILFDSDGKAQLTDLLLEGSKREDLIAVARIMDEIFGGEVYESVNIMYRETVRESILEISRNIIKTKRLKSAGKKGKIYQTLRKLRKAGEEELKVMYEKRQTIIEKEESDEAAKPPQPTPRKTKGKPLDEDRIEEFVFDRYVGYEESGSKPSDSKPKSSKRFGKEPSPDYSGNMGPVSSYFGGKNPFEETKPEESGSKTSDKPIKFSDIFEEDKGRVKTMPQYLEGMFSEKEFGTFIDGLSEEHYSALRESIDLIGQMNQEIDFAESWAKRRGKPFDRSEHVSKRIDAERKIRNSIRNYLKPKKEIKAAPSLTTYDPVLDATPHFNWLDKAYLKTAEYVIAPVAGLIGNTLEAAGKGIGILK